MKHLKTNAHAAEVFAQSLSRAHRGSCLPKTLISIMLTSGVPRRIDSRLTPDTMRCAHGFELEIQGRVRG